MNNIVLCGFMGCGKSTIGNVLARRLKMNYIDIDECVVKSENRSIKELIDINGEKYFRDAESEIIKNIRNCTNTVISLGGGAVLRNENVSLLKRLGVIVYLHVDESIIYERLRHDKNRPLFGVVSYEERIKVYENVSDISVDASGDVEVICDKIINLVTLEVQVNVSNQYNVIVGNNLLERIGEILSRRLQCGNHVALIGDAQVFAIYAQRVIKSLKSNGYNVSTFAFASGETSKTLSTVEKIYNFFSRNDIVRGDMVLGLGGGVCSDIVGFAASTYMRGIECVHIPTSLLAQVDASVGGKTGVNLPFGKNLVGTFYQPKLVVEDMDTLNTLSEREFNSGMAEIIKCACIQDELLFDMLSGNYKEHLKEIIFRAVSIKRDIVVKDELDFSIRLFLNFGHTIGHALEFLSNFKLSHGEAVSVGMCIMTKASESFGITKSGTYEKLFRLCKSFSLPTSVKSSEDEIMSVIRHDKKRRDESISCVLLEDVAKPIIKRLSLEEVRDFVHKGLA